MSKIQIQKQITTIVAVCPLRKEMDEIEKLVGLKGGLSSHEFPKELDSAVSEDPKIEQNKSDYVYMGDGVTLRISDHYSNTKSFADNDNMCGKCDVLLEIHVELCENCYVRTVINKYEILISY